MIKETLISVTDAAKMIKISPQQVRTYIRENKLKAERVGNTWVIDKNDVEDFVRNYEIIVEPEDHERLTEDIPDIIALSFFSGAMGLDIGLENVGIKTLLASENNKACRMTIESNKPDIALIGDINNYTVEEILKKAKIPKDVTIDVIYGGPPCQAFSTAGGRKGFYDHRGNVFLTFLNVIEEIKPRYCIIENVRGLLSTPYPYNSDEPIKGGAMLVILEKLRKAGYTVSFELYNAANFGSPQIRERVVIIGKLGKSKVPYLTPTHSDNPEDSLPRWRTIKDAWEGLDSEKQSYIKFPENRLKYYRILKEGQYWKHLPEELQKEALGKSFYLGGGKTGFLRRLSFGKPSPTLVTNPAMPATDLAHPIEDRPLSIEEYKRIQEFPDNWKIQGNILDQYRQIGNAVPIKLGEAIGKAIINDMRGISQKNKKPFKHTRYKNTNDIEWDKMHESIMK